MDSRERVERCLRHQEADRVPVDFWASGELQRILLRRHGETDWDRMLDRWDVDFRYIEGPRYVGPTLAVRPDGSKEDHFGVPRVSVRYGEGEHSGVYSEVVDFPLAGAASVDEVESYPHWPSPDHFDYDCVREQARRARETGRVVVFMGDRMNRCAQLKPAMYVRGVEQILVDMIESPEIAEAIFRRIADFYAEYARRTLAAAEGNVDILFTGDDFGTQTSLFLSPAAWRGLLRDGFRRFIDIGHNAGCRVAHHTCGSIRELIPEFIECGLDILNPLQPDVAGMDYREIKKEFGGRISFHGGISIQKTMPYGTEADIRAEVKDRVDALAGGGGYIFCTAHNIQVDTPPENVEALVKAYRELGRHS